MASGTGMPLTAPSHAAYGDNINYTYPDNWNCIYILFGYSNTTKGVIVIPSSLDKYLYIKSYYIGSMDDLTTTSEFRTITLGKQVSIELGTTYAMTINSSSLKLSENSSASGSAYYAFLLVS